MASPKVSVIIPAYNQAKYLAAAIQSMFDQTYRNLEVIVVNDASTDHTDEVMRQFAHDPRVKYLVHEKNRYAAAARNTGIRAAAGELIAFLDADDLVHREKLQVQVAFLEEHPTIGLTYNSRLEIDEAEQPLGIVRSLPVVTLADLVMGYPYAPSEVVMRREWAIRVGLMDESFVFHGEDPDFHMRLALEGCEMAGVNRILNYRRRHAGRVFRNLAGIVKDELRAFENTFADPRCPPAVLALRSKALGYLNLILSYDAFAQNETALGQELLRKAIQFDQSIFEGGDKELLTFYTMTSIYDGGDHETPLRRVFAQLPNELAALRQYTESAVGHGYLLRGARDLLWGRTEQGVENFNKALALGAQPDEPFLQRLTAQLLEYEAEFGREAAQKALGNLAVGLEKIGNPIQARWLQGHYSVNQAFREYRNGQYTKVPSAVLRAVTKDPSYLTNRGVISILARSTARAMRP
ncbi:MAG: glycosyltransferase family A protein [Caldilineaceae bacterium]